MIFDVTDTRCPAGDADRCVSLRARADDTIETFGMGMTPFRVHFRDDQRYLQDPCLGTGPDRSALR